MRSSHLYLATLLAVSVFLIHGCIEYNYQLTVLPDESAFLTFEMKGDQYDISDGYDQFPPASWNPSRDTINKDDEIIHIITGSRTLEDFKNLSEILDWSSTTADTIYLRKSAITSRKSRLFGTDYEIIITFHSRRFNELYGDIWEYVPEECRLLDDPDADEQLTTNDYKLLEQKFALGILQWNRSRYARRMKRTWAAIKRNIPDLPDTSSTVFSIVSAGWEDDVHRYLNQLDIDEPSFASLDWWNDLRPVFLGRIIDVCGVESIENVQKAVESIELEYQVTRDLEDDVIKFSMILPGKTTETNGLRMEDGSIEWEIKGRTLANEDFTMKARSFDPSIWKIGFSAMVVLVVIRSLRSIIRKRKRVIS